MKTRNGFVSNSSSSSFIVGIGKINDYLKFEKYIKNNGIKMGYNIKLSTMSDILDGNSNACVKNNNIIVESFQEDVHISNKNYTQEDLFFIVDKCNNEGDDDFQDGNYWELNYDIDLSFFDNSDRKIYEAFFSKDSGIDLDNAVASYGAGRNG